MTKKEEKSIENKIEETLAELLDNATVEAKIHVEKIDSGENNHYKVSIETEETGLLIGYHGEVVNSLQLLLGVIMYKKLGKWTRIVLDVGNYRASREQAIKEMVEKVINEVEETGQAIELPFLSPLERRYVHMLLADNENIFSESTGEGKNRRLSIKPKTSV